MCKLAPKKKEVKVETVVADAMEVFVLDRSKGTTSFKFIGMATEDQIKAFKKSLKVK